MKDRQPEWASHSLWLNPLRSSSTCPAAPKHLTASIPQPAARVPLLCLQGVFHVELKYTSRGPRLIEINCRMGGGPVRNTNLLVWGVDMVEVSPVTPMIVHVPDLFEVSRLVTICWYS